MRKIYTLLILLLSAGQMQGQTILTTGVPNSVTTFFGSANFVLTFTITNNNSYPIDITNMDVYRGSTSNSTTFSLYYHTTSLSGSTSFTAPGWNFVTSAPVSSVTANGIYPTFSNFTLTMPANTTWRFMQVCSGSSIVCGGTTAVPNNFQSGGVTIGVGNYQINSANVGYAASGTSSPYFWAGTITFAPAVPCTAPPTAGTATVSNGNPCSGLAINLNLSGNTGGLTQTYQWQSAPSATGPWTNVGASQTGAYYPLTAPAATTYYRAFVTCNSMSDTSLPVTVNIPTAFPAGTYTIDNTQPTGSGNFNSFADAAAAINCGVTGPIVFNVTAGTYNNDHFRLDNYINGPGKSVTINGNGAILSNLSSSASEPGIIRLNGTKKVTIDNLKIQGISSSTSQWAWGIFMTNNADSNTVTNCQITLDTTATSTNYAGIVMSGSSASATTANSGCDGIVINNNIIKGGYYGITLMGSTTVNILQGNTITNNTIKDFYIYGIYASYSNNMLIENNDISRPSRTSVTTFGGIYLTTGHANLNVSKNRIHDPAASNVNASFTQYGIYLSGAGSLANPNTFSNNLIYNLQGGGTGIAYGLYNSTGTYARYYYNTVSNDFTGSTGTGAAYGFYQTGTSTGIQFFNNNISVTRGGTGAKYGIFLNTAAATITSNNNNFYINGASGVNNMGYSAATSHVNLGAWQTATTQDAASTAVDPVFLNPVTANFLPTNGAMDNQGTTITGITTDITNAARSAVTPDIGAFEFAVAPCAGTPTPGTINGPTTACPGASFLLNLSGYTIGTGIGIQWQSSPAGASQFANISGATTPSYAVNQTSATDYRALVVCANGGGNDVTTTYTVNMDPYYLCYCSPFTGTQLHTNVSNFMTNVAIPNTTLNSATTTIGAGGYTRLDPSIGTNTATLSQTTPYPLTVTVTSASYSVMAWVDYDQSGTFDSTEATQLTTAGTTATGNITIPITALTGLTGLRVRASTSAGYGINGACTSITTGYETEDYVITVAGPPACIQPTGFSVANLTASTADVSWATVTGAAGYEWAVGSTATPPSIGTPTTATTIPLSGMSPSTQQFFFVRTDCGVNGFSLWSTYSFSTAAINNDPWNAIPVTVGAPCTGNPFTTIGGSQATGEPWPTCAGTGGYYSVWYSFVAPASGAVKITTDFTGGTMSGDSRLALYSTTNLNNYPDYTILNCDDDNGSTVGTRSVMYATGLSNGTTYFVQVDVFDAVAQAATSFPGTFCMEVLDMTSSMLSNTGSCAVGQGFGINAGYKGAASLVDASGNLIAIVKDTAGTGGTYGVSLTKNTAAVRFATGLYYLDRNFLVTGPAAGNIELQLFFTPAELAALQTVASATLSNLSVTRQTGNTCQANFTAASGTTSLLPQIANNTANGVHWLTVMTPGFSNFYIQSGNQALAIQLTSISATNMGSKNRVDWATEHEDRDDAFELQRSANGTDFVDVATIKARGIASTYSYYDELPLAGVNYYRLKMTSGNGAVSYSEVVNAVMKDRVGFGITAYPNPAGDATTVSISGRTTGDATISITDAMGRLVRTIAVDSDIVNVDLKGLASGVYRMTYMDAQHMQTISVSKQ